MNMWRYVRSMDLDGAKRLVILLVCSEIIANV